MPGVVYNVQPQPWEPDHTRWVDAGVVRIGVEYRDVTPEGLAATYADDPVAMAEIVEKSPEGGFSDTGVSFHVVGVADDHEYLRFDAFDEDPHYHYVAPTKDANNVVEYDAAANGPMLEWVLGRLRGDLAAMLRQAGAPALADDVDAAGGAHRSAVDDVERLARQAGATPSGP